MESGRGTLVIAGLPVGYNFGIDMRMWQIGDRFTGVRLIPDGIHFVSYSAQDDEMRQGFFIVVSPKSGMEVRIWDPKTESLEQVSDRPQYESVKRTFLNDFRCISGLAPFDTCMGEESIRDWKDASRFITPQLIERLQPINGQQFLSLSQPSADITDQNARTIFFTQVGKPKPPPDASESEVTLFHINRTAHLEQYLGRANYESELDVVGELQTAFILFLLGMNYDAFVQWRQLIEMLLGCSEAGIRQHKDLFTAVASALSFQVKQMPEDFLFDAGISDDDMQHRKNQKNVFILPLISHFVMSCCDESLQSEYDLQQNVQALDKVMTDKYGEEWTSTFNPEGNDDPPIIIDVSL
jgi:A1 cistron-splicing factor AAR2